MKVTAPARGCCQLQIHLRLLQRLRRISIKLTSWLQAPECLATALVKLDTGQHITYNLTKLIIDKICFDQMVNFSFRRSQRIFFAWAG